jgi:hypothetical protein
MKPEEVAAMLKPCPFCGSKAMYLEVKPEMLQGFMEGFMEGFSNSLKNAGIEIPPVPSIEDLPPSASAACAECNLNMTKATALDVVNAWNSRPEETRLKELANAAHASLSAQVEIMRERGLQLCPYEKEINEEDKICNCCEKCHSECLADI